MEEEKEIVYCKHCGKFEYWGEMRWLHGRCLCRNFYKDAYQQEYGEPYRWNDLEGPRPSREDYWNQEARRK